MTDSLSSSATLTKENKPVDGDLPRKWRASPERQTEAEDEGVHLVDTACLSVIAITLGRYLSSGGGCSR